MGQGEQVGHIISTALIVGHSQKRKKRTEELAEKRRTRKREIEEYEGNS